MTRKIELGLGDIRIECNDKHIYIIKTVAGTPGKILLSYELQDNGTCKQNILPAFQEEAEEKEEPFKIMITDDDGELDSFTEDEMLSYLDCTEDLDDYVRRYLKKLVIEDFDCISSCYGEDTRQYYYDDEITMFLKNKDNPEG